ncbi:MAG: hypothetical protein WC994_01110 [Brumimicrobium sp.]
MKYRYVIALNRMLLTDEKSSKSKIHHLKSNLEEQEVVELMDYVRKYPKQKIKTYKMFTCGFSKN